MSAETRQISRRRRFWRLLAISVVAALVLHAVFLLVWEIALDRLYPDSPFGPTIDIDLTTLDADDLAALAALFHATEETDDKTPAPGHQPTPPVSQP